jgi:hypothetical protein
MSCTIIKGRIIIRKQKEPIPALSKYNYQLYKVCKDASLEELTTLISEKRRDCRYAVSEEILKRCKTDIKLLEDLYTIKSKDSVNLFNNYRKENKDLYFTSELGVTSHCILNYLGYKIPLYTEECIKISERIDNGNQIPEDIQREIATCIVKEILEHYNAKFDEERIINDYNINKKRYENYFFTIHNWCKENYWHK